MLLIAKFEHETTSIELSAEVISEFVRSVHTHNRAGKRPYVLSCFTAMRKRAGKPNNFKEWIQTLRGYYVASILVGNGETILNLRKCQHKNQSHA